MASSTSSAANMISRTTASQSFHGGGLLDRVRDLVGMAQVQHDVEHRVAEDHQIPHQHRGVQQRGRQGGGRHLQTAGQRSEEHTSELQSRGHLVCRLLLEKKKIPLLFSLLYLYVLLYKHVCV